MLNAQERKVAVKKNSGDPVRRGEDQHPQGWVRLHPLVRVEREPVPVNEVPDNPERDVGVVAQPGICQKDVAKQHKQGRAGQAGDSRIVEVVGSGRGQARNHGFTMRPKTRKIK